MPYLAPVKCKMLRINQTPDKLKYCKEQFTKLNRGHGPFDTLDKLADKARAQNK
jgi:hypothetical protein